MATTVYTAIIESEGELYAALCPELDVASQGATVEEATAHLREGVELFLECHGLSGVVRTSLMPASVCDPRVRLTSHT